MVAEAPAPIPNVYNGGKTMPTKTGINGVRSVHFGLPDLEEAVRFFQQDWGLEVVSASPDVVYLRGTGRDFYTLALHRFAQSQLLRIDLSIETKEQADALFASLRDSGVKTTDTVGPLDDIGGGYGFSFVDPDEGRVFRVVAEPKQHADYGNRADRPGKVSHVVLNSPDREAKFFVEKLGFRIIDQSKTITFLNCNSDHHSLALFISKSSSYNHLAFEMQDIDSVMSATGSMTEAGHSIGWGVGRHGPCNNVFCYFVGPGGFIVEYTAQVEQVDETYKFKGPDEWGFPKGRRDQWGLARPTPAFHAPETSVPFSTELFLK
jgi:catechol-2,3-dioxygenase